MTQESASGQQFEFSIGWSAWIGMSVVYVLTYWAYELRYRSLLWNDTHVSDVERFLFPLIPVGILAGSIIIHEAAHAIAMVANDIKVGKIRLEIWGGYTAPTDDSPSLLHIPAAKSFAIYFVGPCSNLALAAACFFFTPEPLHSDEISSPVGLFVDDWFERGFEFNLILALFNLIPLFPLDGGHVLRSILMGISGSATAAALLSGTFSLLVGAAYMRYVISEVIEGKTAGIEDVWQALQSHALLGIYAGIIVLTSFVMLMVALFERSPIGSKSVNLPQRLITVFLVVLLAGLGYVLHFKGYWERLPLPSELYSALFGS